MEGQEIKGMQSSVGNISQMREIITPGGRRTRLLEISEFSIKLREAHANAGELTALLISMHLLSHFPSTSVHFHSIIL